MKVTVFNAKPYETGYLGEANAGKHELTFDTRSLGPATAIYAKGSEAIAVFANDDVSAATLEQLYGAGIKYITARSAGYDHIDLAAAEKYGIRVANVPAYSPEAIAEHALALMLALNRNIVQAGRRVHAHNFSLSGLTGFNMKGKTVGVIGTGKIGSALVPALHGLGCAVLAYDIAKNSELEKYNVIYTTLEELCRTSDIISIHTPLNSGTRYMINKDTLQWMKPGVMLINTSRGAIINTPDVIDALKQGRIGALGIDVYEKEKGLFFYDRSADLLLDDMLARLLEFNNVIITPHQAFLTREALQNIAASTVYNLDCWQSGVKCSNELW